jgi:hypothetical protein
MSTIMSGTSLYPITKGVIAGGSGGADNTTTNSTLLNNSQLNALADKIYTRVLDLAQSRPLHFSTQANQFELESLDLARIRSVSTHNVPDLSVFLPPDDALEVKYNVLNHTCPICLASFEQAKFLVNHFTQQHVMNKPAHKCLICNEFMTLDEYFRHILVVDEKHSTRFLRNNPGFLFLFCLSIPI